MCVFNILEETSSSCLVSKASGIQALISKTKVYYSNKREQQFLHLSRPNEKKKAIN